MGIDVTEDVSDEEVFRLSDGSILHNICELKEYLKHMSDDSFAYHVTADKNDFAAWIKFSVGDSVLADRIFDVKEQDQMYRLVYQRLEELTPKNHEPAEEESALEEHPVTPLANELVNFIIGLVVGFIVGMAVKAAFIG